MKSQIDDNFEAMLKRADAIDRREGKLAYSRYRQVMESFSTMYGIPIDRVTAAFVSLSPNNDYFGNLRSLASVLDGIRQRLPPKEITVSSYRHCLERAHNYATGRAQFTLETKGPKIKAFYHNILFPESNLWVTVDGHMVCIARNENLKMKEAIPRPREYSEIAKAIKRVAFRHFMLPHQVQAITWFARKRLMNIKYDPQTFLFSERDDLWRTIADVTKIEPYPTLSERLRLQARSGIARREEMVYGPRLL